MPLNAIDATAGGARLLYWWRERDFIGTPHRQYVNGYSLLLSGD